MSKQYQAWKAKKAAEWKAYMNPPKPEPVKVKPKAVCSVYFIQDGDAIKIGRTWTTSPQGRLNSMQTGNPRELSLIGFYQGEDELALHRRFKEHRIRGEWFRDNPELRALIAAKCPANDNEPASVHKAA